MKIVGIQKGTYISSAVCATCETKEDAKFLFDFIVTGDFSILPSILNIHPLDHDDQKIANIKRQLGYSFGYLSFPERKRLEELFDVEHPIFGKASVLGEPTHEEAFLCGKLGKTLMELRNNPYLMQQNFKND